MELTTTSYIEPYPQDALGGELGLKAEDIAKALGIGPELIRQKIRRELHLMNIGSFDTFQLKSINSMGRSYTNWVLNVSASKYMVAGWKNALGIGYFQYLLECEEMVQKELPKLRAMYKALADRFLKPKNRAEFITISRVQQGVDIFGLPFSEVITEKKMRSEATAAEWESWKFGHRAKIQEGIAKAQNKALKQGKIIPIANYLLTKKDKD